MSIGTNIATLIAIGVSVVSGVVIAFAGFQYSTAAGDPQKVQLAKNSFIGAFIGLVIASLAFIGPRIVTDMVIKPVGGVALETEVGLNCDNILRNQLIFQRGGFDCGSDADGDFPDTGAAVRVRAGCVGPGGGGLGYRDNYRHLCSCWY